MKIYDIYNRDSDDDGSSYDNNICSDSYGSNSNSISDNDDGDNDCYGNGDIDNGYDVATSGGGSEVMVVILMMEVLKNYDTIVIKLWLYWQKIVVMV